MVNVIGKGNPPEVRSYHANGARVRHDPPNPPMLELLQDGQPIPRAALHVDDVARLQVDRTWQGPATAVDGIPIDLMP